jgi:hypothetical protein
LNLRKNGKQGNYVLFCLMRESLNTFSDDPGGKKNEHPGLCCCP